MKKISLLLVAALFTALFSGCNQQMKSSTQPKQEQPNKKQVKKEKPQKNKRSNEESSKPISASNQRQKKVLDSFKGLSEAVKDKKVKAFMTYQYQKNAGFYKEQKRWIEGARFMSEEKGYKITAEIASVKLNEEKKGTAVFQVHMVSPKGKSVDHQVTYKIIRTDSGWKLDDVPFQKAKDGNITVYYKTGHQKKAHSVIQQTKKLTAFYGKIYHWSPKKPLVFKIYESMSAISATIPYMSLGGWTETGESIKILDRHQNDAAAVDPFLAHELTHRMLSDLTHDNASAWLQEGLATYDQLGVKASEDGKLSLDQQTINQSIQRLSQAGPLLTIHEIDEKTYEDNVFYNMGLLITNYLLQEKGVDSFLVFCDQLKQYPYIDKRSTLKKKATRKRTEKALAEEYGSLKDLSKDYQAYYEK